MESFKMRVALVGNPMHPDIPFDAAAMKRLKQLGFNTVQLNIAWGCRPGDEPLNLEDILSPDDTPDARQQKWLCEIARRAKVAKEAGMRSIFHFGAPRVTGRLYQTLNDPEALAKNTNENSIQREEIVAKYEHLLKALAAAIPELDDILMYTFDQEAWLGDEFGKDPLAAGVPLHTRVTPFLVRLTSLWGTLRPEGRLWWEPWEISAGIIYMTLPQLPKSHFGLMLHSNIAEVQKTNPVDRWFRNMAILAAEQGIPVCGEIFMGGANEEDEPLSSAFAPALVWDEIHRLQDLGIYGVKEYYGTRPDMEGELDLEMAGICFNEPDCPRAEALRKLARRWPQAAALPEAMAAAEKALAVFPWDVSWRWRALCVQHTAWHPYTPFNVYGQVAPSPSWCSTRRAIFMLTSDEEEHHPWLIEDIGLRCHVAAGYMRQAASAYRAAEKACGVAAFGQAEQDFLRFAAVAEDEYFHAEETLCARHIRGYEDEKAIPAPLMARMKEALRGDAQNRKFTSAVAEGAVNEAAEAEKAFAADPIAWCRNHL